MKLARLETLWRTDDPKVAAALERIMSQPVGTPERHEAIAGLHMLQARWEWRDADRLRELHRQRETDTARRRARAVVPPAVCSGCGAVRSVNIDGTVRKHDGPAGTAPCPGSRRPPVA